MELDEVLFGLDPFITSCLNDVPIETTFRDSFITLLDQLAVFLRDEDMRGNQLLVSNIDKFVEATDHLIKKPEYSRDVLMYIIRVLANAVANTDTNRVIVAQNTSFLKHLGVQLRENFDDEEFNERILILLKNLVIDNEQVAEIVAKNITQDLVINIGYEDSFMAIDLLSDLIEYGYHAHDIKLIQSLAKKLKNFVEKQNDFEDDMFSELVVNTADILDKVASDSKLSFKDSYDEVRSQKLLFSLFIVLESIEFQNKLIVQRKIFASIGSISSNPTSSNKVLQNFCLDLITDTHILNGYIISCSFVILGNSISSTSDRDELLERSPSLISLVLSKYDYLVDPVQFQGILHILKVTISFNNTSELFTTVNFPKLEALIEATIRNSRYYTNFTGILVSFLKKLFASISKSQVETISKSTIPGLLISSDNNYETKIILLLLINKSAIYGSTTGLQPLVAKALEFKDANVPVDYLFELTKTIGVLLQHKPELLLENHTEGLKTLLTSVLTITNGPDAHQNVAKAIQNNSTYIAGTLLNLSKTKTIDADLLELSKKFF